MILLKLAIKNLLGAGLRTWLNVLVLSFSFVVIIWLQGFYNGMSEQASSAMIATELGGGQYWQKNYDRYDPFSIPDSHERLSPDLNKMVKAKQATPILVVQGSIFPDGRIMSVLLKGIDPEQTILNIPSHFLRDEETLPALIGENMAKNASLDVGDYFTIRWRDASGAFDAQEAKVVQVMSTIVSSVDNGQIWLPLEKLRQMAGMPDEATIIVVNKEFDQVTAAENWDFKNLDFLLSDLKEMVQSKTIGASIMYVLLLFLAILAIFDTQVLSIFRRRKEIGTLIALGMTRFKVIRLFTLEGALHGVLAAFVAALYGVPLLIHSSTNGWKIPGNTSDYGFALGNTIFPTYGIRLVLGTTLLVLVTVTIVSFLPTRRIAKLRPTDALRGKLS